MNPLQLSDAARGRLTEFARALIDQHRAQVIVPPDEPRSGYWFGGGNLIQDADGSLLLAGRCRSGGDSRTGLQAGTRGRELTIFRSTDQGQSFQKILSCDKESLSTADADVLSIEGACLKHVGGEYRLFVSTEKNGSYPESIAEYQKPGAGVWTIDVLRSAKLDDLQEACVTPLLGSADPVHLHVKDPFSWSGVRTPDGLSNDVLGFCSHPYGWSSSSTGYAVLDQSGDSVREVRHSVIPRGTTWDVAITRVTCVLPVPPIGPFADQTHTLLFYCGGECLRPLPEHDTAVNRPRGYSCEELGGAAVYVDDDLSTIARLSDTVPLFVSPWGTGCSRYVDVLGTENGFFATWQQSQPDQSQPLVLNRLSRDDAEAILR